MHGLNIVPGTWLEKCISSCFIRASDGTTHACPYGEVRYLQGCSSWEWRAWRWLRSGHRDQSRRYEMRGSGVSKASVYPGRWIRYDTEASGFFFGLGGPRIGRRWFRSWCLLRHPKVSRSLVALFLTTRENQERRRRRQTEDPRVEPESRRRMQRPGWKRSKMLLRSSLPLDSAYGVLTPLGSKRRPKTPFNVMESSVVSLRKNVGSVSSLARKKAPQGHQDDVAKETAIGHAALLVFTPWFPSHFLFRWFVGCALNKYSGHNFPCCPSYQGCSVLLTVD